MIGWIVMIVICWSAFTTFFLIRYIDVLDSNKEIIAAFCCCIVFPLALSILIPEIYQTVQLKKERKQEFQQMKENMKNEKLKRMM